MNGGFDVLCGRMVYYDEVINDFGSNDSNRIEYLKTITMCAARPGPFPLAALSPLPHPTAGSST